MASHKAHNLGFLVRIQVPQPRVSQPSFRFAATVRWPLNCIRVIAPYPKNSKINPSWIFGGPCSAVLHGWSVVAKAIKMIKS